MGMTVDVNGVSLNDIENVLKLDGGGGCTTL